jgi:DNA-binding MarR family transcriptional regulator
MDKNEELVRATQEFARCFGRMMRRCASDSGVTPQQAETIQYVYEQDGTVPALKLAAVLGVDPSTLSRNLDALVRADLISRKPHKDDARRNDVYLTTRGRRLAEKISSTVSETVTMAFDRGASRIKQQHIYYALTTLATELDSVIR